MGDRHGRAEAANHWFHRSFLWLLVATYLLAGFFPQAGLMLRSTTNCHLELCGQSAPLTVPLMLLAFLLFSAGLGVRTSKLLPLFGNPWLLLLGLAANILVPIMFIYASGFVLSIWPNGAETQTIIVGLTFVAAMPIAGSSAAWSQRSEGDLGLSLGLILVSTLLSPFTTPFVLQTVQPLLTPDYANTIREVGKSGTGGLLGLFVMLPAFFGIVVGNLAGQEQLAKVRPSLKLLNSLCLLILIYANAVVSLPDSVHHPDADFLVLIAAIVMALCVTTFATGWVLAWALNANASRRNALMFGLGMNNNGAGLALASVVLAAYPEVMLPIILYNLEQHLVAAIVSRMMSRSD